MISQAMHEALNTQINRELFSSYQYLAMAAYFDSQSLDGFSHWMKAQAQEEVQHAMRIYDFLCALGKPVNMLAIEQPKIQFKSSLEVFENALAHEQQLARALNDISDLAMREKDNTTYSFLDWFLTEQVEEISLTGSIVDKIRLIGDNGFGLLMLNNELGKRSDVQDAAQD